MQPCHFVFKISYNKRRITDGVVLAPRLELYKLCAINRSRNRHRRCMEDGGKPPLDWSLVKAYVAGVFTVTILNRYMFLGGLIGVFTGAE